MGGGAAFIMPATLSILTNVFTDARERAMAIGIWSGVVGLGVVLGPAGRRLPARPLLVGFGLHRQRARRRRRHRGLAAGLVPESRDPDGQHVDWTGGGPVGRRPRCLWCRPSSRHPTRAGPACRSSALFAFVGVRPWSCFVAWERRAEHPDARRALFPRTPGSRAASATITLVFFALFGFVFLSTQYLQFVLGYSPFAAGLRTLPFAAAMIVAAPFSPKLVERSAPSGSWSAGMVIVATGLVDGVDGRRTATGYRRLGLSMLAVGCRAGLDVGSGDRVDHGLAAPRSGRSRLRRQRHRP